MKRFLIGVSICALSCFLIFSSPVFGKQKPEFVTGELLVQPKPWVSDAKIKATIKNHGAQVIGEIAQIKVKRIRVPKHAWEKVQTALQHNPQFAFVEKNAVASAAYIPNDEKYSSQWHLPKIQSPSGWDLTFGSDSEPIAIIDSGVDPDHPDLGSKIIAGKNFLDGTSDTHDVYGHGTAVAGSAAALSDNLSGVAGIAWDNPIMPLVVLSSDNWAYYSDIASAITYAADKGVRVINISIAGSSSSYTLQNAVNYAWERGAVIVAAAANYSTDNPYYPAACDNVLAVAATDSNDNLASFSNYGDWIDLSAPGTSIVTTTNGGGYSGKSGTSFSSPITAGVAALMFSANPKLSNADLVNLLAESADDLGAYGFDPTFGYGRVNAYNAVLAALNLDTYDDTTAPNVEITFPTDGAIVSDVVAIDASANDDTTVEVVEFFVNQSLVGSDATEPFSFSWDSTTVGDGSHEISAQATDSSGNVGISSKVSVTVDNEVETEDTTPPDVSLTSPNDGESVSGSVTISASATDDTGIAHVDFYINNTFVDSDTSSPYELGWDTTGTSDGEYTLSAIAQDTWGNEGSSSPVSVQVNNVDDSNTDTENTQDTDTLSPTVQLVTAKIGNPRMPKFKIDASASDDVGVTRIEIYLDGTLKAEENASTLKWMWETGNGDSGNHTITAKAYDAAGNVGVKSTEVSL